MRRMWTLLFCMLLLSSCTSAAQDPAAIPLRVWVGDHADVPWLEQVLRDFYAAHPDRKYDIQIGIQNEGDVAKVVLSDVEAAADIFTFVDDQINSLLNAGALMPILEGADAVRSANTSASVEAATGPDGQLYAYPATADNGYFLFYNSAYITPGDATSFGTVLDRAAANGKKVAFPLSNERIKSPVNSAETGVRLK